MTGWYMRRNKLRILGFKGLSSVPCCDFTLLKKSNPQHLQAWASLLPSVNSNFQGMARMYTLWILAFLAFREAGGKEGNRCSIPSVMFSCTLPTYPALH